MVNKIKIKNIYSNEYILNLKQKLYLIGKQSLNNNKYYFKVYFPQYNILESDGKGLAWMTHVPSQVNINIKNIIEYFLTNDLLYLSPNNIEYNFENFLLGIIAHEFGHDVVTLDHTNWKNYHLKRGGNLLERFLMYVVNVVDDTVLQHLMSNLHRSFKEALYTLGQFGQGYIQYINYLCSEDNSMQNILYYLILYAYKDTHREFFDDKFLESYFKKYQIIDKDNFYTKDLLKEFTFIRTVSNIYKRQELIYDFAQKLYNLLLKDYKDELDADQKTKSDQQIRSEFDNKINEALDNLESNANIKPSNVKSNPGKGKGNMPIQHTIIDQAEPIDLTLYDKFKNLYGYSKDSLTNIFLNNDIGLKRNLKNGALDPSNIPYSSIKTNVFYSDNQEVNIPDLTLITLVDCSGSMSENIKDLDTTFYDYVIHMITMYESAFVEQFKETRIINLTFNYDVYLVNDNINKMFNKQDTLKAFKAADHGSGTQPQKSLEYINDLVDTITTKSKILLIVTDGEFNETPEIKSYVKSLQQKLDLVIVINLTGKEFNVFKEKTIVLNYDYKTIKKCYLDLSSIIQDKFIMKGGD